MASLGSPHGWLPKLPTFILALPSSGLLCLFLGLHRADCPANPACLQASASVERPRQPAAAPVPPPPGGMVPEWPNPSFVAATLQAFPDKAVADAEEAMVRGHAPAPTSLLGARATPCMAPLSYSWGAVSHRAAAYHNTAAQLAAAAAAALSRLRSFLSPFVPLGLPFKSYLHAPVCMRLCSSPVSPKGIYLAPGLTPHTSQAQHPGDSIIMVCSPCAAGADPRGALCLPGCAARDEPGREGEGQEQVSSRRGTIKNGFNDIVSWSIWVAFEAFAVIWGWRSCQDDAGASYRVTSNLRCAMMHGHGAWQPAVSRFAWVHGQRVIPSGITSQALESISALVVLATRSWRSSTSIYTPACLPA
jgi:hypothetical protein